jgi:hypothetical protein
VAKQTEVVVILYIHVNWVWHASNSRHTERKVVVGKEIGERVSDVSRLYDLTGFKPFITKLSCQLVANCCRVHTNQEEREDDTAYENPFGNDELDFKYALRAFGSDCIGPLQ